MKIERTKNATRNIVFDGMAKMMNMFIPFVMRSIILNFLGMEYLGLGGLFNSILSVLSLAELGIGSAMSFSMYKPIAEDDTETVCALMKLYKTAYRIIGLVVLVIGLILTPFLPYLINDEVTADVNLYVLYFMNIGSTVISYWLFAHKICLIYAHQRVDIVSKIAMIINFTGYVLKILILIFLRNYYLYLAIQLLSQVAYNIFVGLKASSLYPKYSPRGSLPKEKVQSIARRVRDLFTSNFSAVVSSTADTLIISAFLGLTVLAIYQNYYYIISSLKTLIEVIVGACIAGIGNSFVTESPEKNYRDLRKMTLLFGWVISVAGSMLLCLYQPFMQIWMGEKNMLEYSYVACFVMFFYTMGMNRLIGMFKDAAGIWKIDKWRPLTAAITNLILNIATVRWLGLYGVLLSTVISDVVIQIPWGIRNLFKSVFPHEHLWEYVRMYCGIVAVELVCCVTSRFACDWINLGVWPTLIINAVISFLIPNIIFIVIFGRNDSFKESVAQIIRVVLRRK